MSDTSTQENITEIPLTKWQAFRKEWGGFTILLICLFTFRSVIADWNAVPTGSMKPTIYEGDRIWVNKLTYGLRVPFTNIRIKTLGQPERGDIVVFPEPNSGKRYIKRVVGMPGDTIDVINNLVHLNGEPIEYSRYDEQEIRTFSNVPGDVELRNGEKNFLRLREVIGGVEHPIQVSTIGRGHSDKKGIKVPEGHIYVLGDNRDQSSDSRVIGFVDTNTLIGKATRVAWSHDYDNYYFFRKERFFKPIDELSEVNE